mgnify:CR=1 FL=1
MFFIETDRMSANTDKKQERINLRLQPQAKAMLERAASFEGKTVSSFILASAITHAEEKIHEHETMQLAAQNANEFFQALDKPVRFNPRLVAALEEHQYRVANH